MKKPVSPVEAAAGNGENARREQLRLCAAKDAETLRKLREEAEQAHSARMADVAEKKAAVPAPPAEDSTEAPGAEHARKQREAELIDAAARGAAIAAGMAQRPPKKRRHVPFRLILTLIVLAAVIVAILVLYPRVRDTLRAPAVNITVPDSLSDLLPDEEMGYNKIDFSEAILGEARETQVLEVMQQDVEVPIQITQALGNIDLFKKTRVIRSYGTGAYTVDLGQITKDCITTDESAMIVTIRIPHAQLQHVIVHADKTTFEDTQKAIFAIGEIKLTAEQQQILDTTVKNAMEEKLNEAGLFLKADEIALSKVRDIFQPLVTALAADYIVKIVMD